MGVNQLNTLAESNIGDPDIQVLVEAALGTLLSQLEETIDDSDDVEAPVPSHRNDEKSTP